MDEEELIIDDERCGRTDVRKVRILPETLSVPWRTVQEIAAAQ
jgi:hypothetical protein